MNIDVKARNEQGEILFEGTLNRKEIGFLLQFGINELLADGVKFNLQEPDEGENRFSFPKEELND